MTLLKALLAILSITIQCDSWSVVLERTHFY